MPARGLQDVQVLKALAQRSEAVGTQMEGKDLRALADNDPDNEDIPSGAISPEGLAKEALVKVPVNQQFFRKTILATYEDSYCITSIRIPQLLVASHIIPWATPSKYHLDQRTVLA